MSGLLALFPKKMFLILSLRIVYLHQAWMLLHLDLELRSSGHRVSEPSTTKQYLLGVEVAGRVDARRLSCEGCLAHG